MGLPRISGSDMLFTAILTLAGIVFVPRHGSKAFAPLWLFAGFALVAPSALAGGLLGLVLPLLVSLVFLLWRWNVPPGRGTRRSSGVRAAACPAPRMGYVHRFRRRRTRTAEDPPRKRISGPRPRSMEAAGARLMDHRGPACRPLASLDAALAVPSLGADSSVPSSRVSWSTASNAPAKAGCGAAPS